MKRLFEYLIHNQWEDAVLKEEANLIGEEMINESFKSSIVQKLAQTIYDYEKENNKREVRQAKDQTQRYGYEHTPKLTNFTSIFGPKMEVSKYGVNKGLRGIKWSEITDDDLTEYNPTDKELIKLLKKSYRKETGNADFIIMNKDGKITHFIKCFGADPKESGVYFFKDEEPTKWGKINSRVEEIRQKGRSWSGRSLNVNEVVDFLSILPEGSKVYALVITDSMLQDYRQMGLDRKETQKGVINYDAESLKNMLRKQQSRYKALVAEMKAKKLMADPEALFEDIQQINDEVIDLVHTITQKPEYIDKRFDVSRMLQYVGYAFEQYYNYVKSLRSADKEVAAAKKYTSSDEEAEKYGSYSREEARGHINDCKEYINKVKEFIKEIKSEM